MVEVLRITQNNTADEVKDIVSSLLLHEDYHLTAEDIKWILLRLVVSEYQEPVTIKVDRDRKKVHFIPTPFNVCTRGDDALYPSEPCLTPTVSEGLCLQCRKGKS